MNTQIAECQLVLCGDLDCATVLISLDDFALHQILDLSVTGSVGKGGCSKKNNAGAGGARGRIVSVLQLQSSSKELENSVLPQAELSISTTPSFHCKLK